MADTFDNLRRLLEEVYPALPTEQPAAVALELARQMLEEHPLGPMDHQKAKVLFNATLSTRPTAGRERYPALSKLRQTIIRQANPWKAKSSRGWAIAASLAHRADYQALDVLLCMDGAPNAHDLSSTMVERWWSGSDNSKQVICPGPTTLLGMACADLDPDSPNAEQTQIISVLTRHGADLHGPVESSGKPAIAISGWSKDTLGMLFECGLDPSRQLGGKSQLAWAFSEKSSSYWMDNILTVLCFLADTNPSFAGQIKKVWDEGLAVWGKLLADNTDRALEQRLKQLAELSQSVDLSLSAREPGKLNLFGVFSRHLVLKADQDGNLYSIRNAAPIEEAASKAGLRHLWTGAVEPDIPDGAWALIAAGVRAGHDRKGPGVSTAAANGYTGGRDKEFWLGFERLLEKMGHTEPVRAALVSLQTAIPKAHRHTCRDIVFARTIDQFIANEDAINSPNGNRMLPLAKHVIDLVDRNDEHFPADPTDAICLYIINGWKRDKTEEVAERILQDYPQRVDFARIGKVLDISRRKSLIDHKPAARLQALLLDTHSPTVSIPGATRRL